jgi:hypothetical protein
MTSTSRSRRALAVVLAGLALGAPPALAQGVEPVRMQDLTEQQVLASRGQSAPAVVETATAVQSADGGLDWRSAAIGAGAACLLALGAVALGGRTRLRAPRS